MFQISGVSLFIIVLVIGQSITLENYKVVDIDSGRIRGRLETSILEQKSFYAFRGVPYARPPINDLRFKAPQDVEPWSGIKDTFEFGNDCIQRTYILKNVIGAEDCLFLNVYVPANLKGPTAVMVFIHGGAFYFGSSSLYGPDLLVNKDVILVTLNYRLGPYGFLSLGTPDYSGNMGLKDQLAAIKWVKRNIDNFGGDSNMITIFGESAGSVSVESQILSPQSHGLFQRAIMQSGALLNPWAFYEGKDHVEYLLGLAKKFGHNLKTKDELKDFLNRVDPELLIQSSYTDYTEENVVRTSEQRWVPLVENADAKDPFMLKSPRDLLGEKSNQDIDLMLGFTSNEMYWVTLSILNNPYLFEEYNKNFLIQFPRRDWKYNVKSKEYKKMAKEIKDFYIGSGPINQDSYLKFNDLASDTTFVYGVHESANYHFQRSNKNVYYYKFSLDTNLNVFKKNDKMKLPGSSHADDIIYLFKFDIEHVSLDHVYQNITKDSIEKRGIEQITGLWTNFAKFGTPTPQSEPVRAEPITKDHLHFVEITNDGLVKGVNPFAERMKFWTDFYVKYEHVFQKSFLVKDEL